jgi:hypothetical protein
MKKLAGHNRIVLKSILIYKGYSTLSLIINRHIYNRTAERKVYTKCIVHFLINIIPSIITTQLGMI